MNQMLFLYEYFHISANLNTIAYFPNTIYHGHAKVTWNKSLIKGMHIFHSNSVEKSTTLNSLKILHQSFLLFLSMYTFSSWPGLKMFSKNFSAFIYFTLKPTSICCHHKPNCTHSGVISFWYRDIWLLPQCTLLFFIIQAT